MLKFEEGKKRKGGINWMVGEDGGICLIMMLRKQIENLLATFREEGGFSEGLTAERLAYRTGQSVQSNAPACPKCGKPMIKRVAKKGVNAGNEFWSCSRYPECNGLRKVV
ncbi:MAG: topoisomerase DNA-binding C4 zinc finger domain-containing protein [Paludibacteraceae bacterium]|nr:topoisomerase DNA-binding C4 zinc finger domain-containing protein [Paludibacteraceae bacterium]